MIINNLRHNQSRSLFPLKSPFRPLFGAFCPQISAESGSGHPPSRTRETWLATNVHLATVLPPHAPRPTPHAPRPTPHASRRRAQRGSDRAQTLPRWLLPSTDRRIDKDRRGPISMIGLSLFSMSPNRAILSDRSNFSSPHAAAQPWGGRTTHFLAPRKRGPWYGVSLKELLILSAPSGLLCGNWGFPSPFPRRCSQSY
jgi:hypothetical protein